MAGYGSERASDQLSADSVADPKGFPKSSLPSAGPRRILSPDMAEQQRGWAGDVPDLGGQRELSASAAAAMRVLMRALLLAGAATCARRCEEAAEVSHVQPSRAGDPDAHGRATGERLSGLTALLCADFACFRKLLACSPEDAALLLHCICRQMIDSAREEPGGVCPDLKVPEGRAAWEAAFSRRVLAPVLEAADAVLARQRAALDEGRGSRRAVPAACDGKDSFAWQYRAPVTLDLCQRHLERSSTDPRHLPVLRGFMRRGCHLRALKHLAPAARLCAALCERYGRGAASLAEVRALRIGDVARGRSVAAAGLQEGLDAFRSAWVALVDDLPLLVPAGIAAALQRVLARPRDEYGLDGGGGGRFRGLGDDSPATFLLPSASGEGVCALALLVGLVRVQNDFLEAHSRALRRRYGVRVDPAPLPVAQLGPGDVLDADVLPLVLAHAERAAEEEGPGGAVRWDMAALERVLVRRCVEGRRRLDEASVPQARFGGGGGGCAAAALDGLRAAGLGRPLPESAWRALLGHLPCRFVIRHDRCRTGAGSSRSSKSQGSR